LHLTWPALAVSPAGYLVAEQEDQANALRLLAICLESQRQRLRRERAVLADYEKRQKRVTDVLALLAERKETLAVAAAETAAAPGPTPAAAPSKTVCLGP